MSQTLWDHAKKGESPLEIKRVNAKKLKEEERDNTKKEKEERANERRFE